jgi:3-mercaptopyruvate sulfurtransferase SseA
MSLRDSVVKRLFADSEHDTKPHVSNLDKLSHLVDELSSVNLENAWKGNRVVGHIPTSVNFERSLFLKNQKQTLHLKYLLSHLKRKGQ